MEEDTSTRQQLDYVNLLAEELLGSEAQEWISTPNSYFFGKSPAETIALGDAEAVIELLSERLGRV